MTRAVSTDTLRGGPTLSYAEQGDRSGPALVLLPGPLDSWQSHRQVVERMPLTIRTIAVSQRGHGDSDKPPTGYRIEDFAADVVVLLDALRIERAVLGPTLGLVPGRPPGCNRSTRSRGRPGARSFTSPPSW